MDYPQDWLSSADRGSIGAEVCRRYQAFRDYEASKVELGEWCDRYAEALGRSEVTSDDVRKWIDLGGWWKGTRRGVALELRFTASGVEWRATKKKKTITGISAHPFGALQDIGAELSRRLYVDHKAAKEAEAEAEAA